MTRGFTLLEVMVALVVTSVVASLGYATLQGALDTRDRMDRWSAEEGTLITTEQLIRDAVRHAAPGVRGGPAVFSLTDRSMRGVPGDSVSWMSHGVHRPAGTGAAWQVSVSVGPDGLRYVAVPPDASAPARLARVPGIRSLEVVVADRTGWQTAWPDGSLMPRAMAFTLETSGGARHAFVIGSAMEGPP